MTDQQFCRVTGGPTGVDQTLQLCVDEGTCGRPARYELRSLQYGEDSQGVPHTGTFSFACEAHGQAWVSDFGYSGWYIANFLAPATIVIEEDMDARDFLVANDRQSAP